MCYTQIKIKVGINMARIFNNKITPSCLYCKHGQLCVGTTKVVCLKKGVSDSYSSCRHFKYNPLKREPKLRISENKFTKDDFKL